MSWATRVANLCRRLLHRRQTEEELDSEVQAYFEIRAETYVALGMSPEEAHRAARMKYEGPEQVKQNVREARMEAAIEATVRDIRYACRALWRSPGFTATAVLTLAVGIGANTAIFSLIDAVMLRLLPVDRPEQLVLLTDPAESGVDADTTQEGVRSTLSYPEFEELQSHNKVFSGMFAAQNEVSKMDVFPGGDSAGRSVKANMQLVSGDFFRVLGIHPIAGRVFTGEEDKPGVNAVAVVSYDCWQREFGGRRDIVGSTMRAGQANFVVLGVAPRGFRGILVGSSTDFWLPITMQRQVLPGRNYLKARDTLWLQVMGRLAQGMPLRTAQAGINVTFQQTLSGWAAALPNEKERRGMMNQKIELRRGARGASALRGQFSDPLVLLMAMVGVVLLIACANIANLMLARASGRQREIGVRLALGAARIRLIRQLLTESLLVAACGGALGLLLAALGTRLLVALVSTGVPALALDVTGDGRVFLFTTAVSLLTGVLFGLMPAIRATRLDANRTLAANARGSIGGRGRVQTGRVLAVAQVALSLVLLMGAALFVRSLHNMITENLGYSQDHLLMVRIDPLAAGYKPADVAALYEKLRGVLGRIRGVSTVTLSNDGLFTGEDFRDQISLDGSPVRDPEILNSWWTEVGPDYFQTLGIPLLQGREINESDALRGTPVCIVNESFARRFFPNSNALGKHVTDKYPTTRETFEIIGVAADAREHAPSEQKRPRFYANLAHPIGFVGAVTLVLRSSGDPGNVGSAAQQAIRRLDPGLPVLSVITVNEQIGLRLITERLVAQLAAFFGAVALFMASIGLYGVMAYSISSRTSEIGIRMALGASAQSVIRMVLGETLGMVGIGIGIGLPCALLLGRLISSKLYGVTAADPTAIGLTGLIILTTAALAGYVPARRASRIDPLAALRHE